MLREAWNPYVTGEERREGHFGLGLYICRLLSERHGGWLKVENGTCGALLGYQILLSFAGAVGTAAVALVLSAVCRNPMAAVVASAAVHIVPTLLPVPESDPLFRLLALLPVYQMQFEALMSLGQLRGGLPYAVWALPVSAGLLAVGYGASRKIFASREVS